MENYQKTIEESLSQYVPSCVQLLLESEKYVDKAPKVNGYFKFISLRYMKRVNDIKKMCIEYINTYIDGCLNLANKMDDVKLVEARDSLAKDLDFELKGISTQDESKKADTKTGVLFLTGDKALKDKLDTLVKKIELRAQKSESLVEWAKLMLLQSKIQAADIVFDKTNEMIKDENLKKEKEKSEIEEVKTKYKDLETRLKAAEKKLDDYINKYGERSTWFKKDIDVKDLINNVKSIDNHDLNKPIVNDDENLNDDGSANELRKTFYDDNGYAETAKQNAKELKDNVQDVSDNEWQYLFACSNVDKMKDDGSFTASPVDVCIAMANTPEAVEELNKSKYKKQIDIDLNAFTIDGLDKSKAKQALNEIITDKDFITRLVFIYTRMFADNNVGIKESFYVMKSNEFMFEQIFDTTMKLRDMELAIMDVLDECDGGCLYIGNFPNVKDIDYVMLDGDGGWGFYKELGNIDIALATGEPQNVNLIEMTDGQKSALLNVVLDKFTEEIMGKLK